MSIASAILFCARQCIALRGNAEDGKSEGNPGNLLALLKLLAQSDKVLRKHLAPAMRSATHLSPQTQNELLGVMGKHMILKAIIDDLKMPSYLQFLRMRLHPTIMNISPYVQDLLTHRRTYGKSFLPLLGLSE